MKVRLKQGLVILTGETQQEREELQAWSAGRDGYVFFLKCQDPQTIRLNCLGPQADVCREPINISSRSPDPVVQWISNLAPTAFELDGWEYGSVEAFWQGLKFPDPSRRLAIAPLHGQEARRAGFEAPSATTFKYQGREVRVGTWDHWQLMARACWSKFRSHQAARDALLGTGERPLEHKTRKDSRNIPGVLMADIWMKIRRGLQKQQSSPEATFEDASGHDSSPDENAEE